MASFFDFGWRPLRTSWLVACDGLHSPVARAVGLAEPEPRARRRYGQRAHYGLEPWTDRWDRATLTSLVPAADRISCLHRAESWVRLQADVPRRVVDEDFLRSPIEWVVDAAAPDPYVSGIPR